MRQGMNGINVSAIAALLLFGLVLPCLTAAARDIVELKPAAFQPGDNSPAAATTPDGGIMLPLPFQPGIERFFWDVSIPPLQNAGASIVMEFACDDPGAIRALTLHLQDGDNWLSAAAVPQEDQTGMLIFNRADFSAESGAPLLHQARKMRLSFWQAAARPTVFHLHSLREEQAAIAIIRGGSKTAPGETALAIQCAERAARLFLRAGLPAAIVDDDFEALDLKNLRWIVLPYNPALDPQQIKLLEKFVKQHTGRIAVFYNSNRHLAELLNVKLMPYSSQPRPWTTVEFVKDSIQHLPDSMPHFTSHLLPAGGDGKSSCTTGYWLTTDGFRDTSLPAAVKSANGLWFSHIPPLATPSAVQWLAAQLAASDTDHLPTLERLTKEIRERESRARQLSGGQPAVSNEIRGVWSPAIPARQRESIMQKLSSNGINVVFEHVATAGMLRERPDGGISAAASGSRRMRLLLKNITEAAHRYEIELHAWVILFNAEGLPPAMLERLRTEDRLMMDQYGEILPWLCPSHPANRTMLRKKLTTLAATEVDGIHLDYIRYPGSRGCYSPASRRAFEQQHTLPVENWPADVIPGGKLADAYESFRRNEMTSFLRETVQHLRSNFPDLKISAAVFPTVESAAENSQDWPQWLQQNLLDFICPMIYTARTAQFQANCESAIKTANKPAHIVPGIGVTADESQLDALSVIEQINAARELNAGGFVLFQLDIELLDRILPVLSQRNSHNSVR